MYIILEDLSLTPLFMKYIYFKKIIIQSLEVQCFWSETKSSTLRQEYQKENKKIGGLDPISKSWNFEIVNRDFLKNALKYTIPTEEQIL